jgi:prepilin-type N-terminal cleavage/methylation domain-containing protein
MQHYKAVSLMEVLVVIAIIGIMTTVGFVSLDSGKSQAKLQAAQREIASVIKLTQSYALQGKVAPDGATPCGYGIRFDPADSSKMSYEIFYNTWTTGGWGYTDCTNMNADLNTRHWRNGTPHSQIFQSFTLKDGVILSTSPDIYAGGNPNITEIYFTIPVGNIYGYDGNTYVGPKIFTFELSGKTKTINIDSGGSVTEN